MTDNQTPAARRDQLFAELVRLGKLGGNRTGGPCRKEWEAARAALAKHDAEHPPAAE